MKYTKLSRRMFLQGSAGTLLSIPFLTSLVPEEARGAENEPIKRYLGLTTAFNVGHNRLWYPTVNDLPNKIALPGNPNMAGHQRLSNFMLDGRAGLSKIINSSMNPYLNQMMIYKSLDIVSSGFHAWAHHLGATYHDAGTASKVPTIDNFLASHIKFDPAKRAAIHLGMGGGGFSRNALGQVVSKGPVAYNALASYRVLFNNGAYPEAGGGGSVHPRRDLLSRVLSDYKRISQGRQIASADKIVLEHVMDNMSDLQAGLSAQVSAMCKHTGQDETVANNKNEFLLDDSLNYRNYVMLIKAIFLCDMSRVVTFNSGISNAYDNSGSATPDYHSNVTHAPYTQSNNDYMASIYAKSFTHFLAPLFAELNSCIDPVNGKSFLHNGLAHVSAESVYTHRNANTPTLTVGSFNGALPTGYMVDYGDPNRIFTFAEGAVNGGTSDDKADPLFSFDHPGVPYNRFLVTLLQSIGFTDSDYAMPELNARLLKRSDSLYGAQNNGINYVGGYGRAAFDDPADSDYHHVRRMARYNFHYFKDPLPLPPKV